MNIRVATTLLASAFAVSCGETSQEPASQLNLDRPIDVSFGCYGGMRVTEGQPATVDQDVIVSAQPLSACETRSGARGSEADPIPVPTGQEPLTMQGGIPIPNVAWYGFILQSSTGTVAITQWQTKPSSLFGGEDVSILDADALTPGINGISVGEDPVAITPDRIGCYQVIANGGSCDLTILDIASAVDVQDPDVRVERMTIKNASGADMLARPAAMVGDAPSGDVGFRCPMQATGIAYIAYPACHLVAAVDTSTGTIVAGIDFSSGTPTITDGNVSCPAECGDARGTFTAGVRPTALDLEYDERNLGTRLLIGAENSSQLTLVNIDPTTRLPASLQPVVLEDTTGGTMGVTAVAIGPQIGVGGNDGALNDDIAPGGQFQFIYAIATDDSVRVADVLGANPVECDTNVDPRLIDGENSVRTLSCFPVGDAATPARRANALGPGIRLPGTYHDVVPTSLDIVRSSGAPGTEIVRGPSRLVGYFTIVSASNGSVYIIDIDDDDRNDFKDQGAPLVEQLPLAIAHHLRDAIPDRSLTATIDPDDGPPSVYCDNSAGVGEPDPDSQNGNRGGVRSVGSPTRNVPAGFVAAEKVGELPSIHQVQCTGTNQGAETSRPVSELSFYAPADVRDIVYQDLISLRNESWTMTYEGTLSVDSPDVDVDGPPVRVSQIVVDSTGMRLVDAAKPYCDAGVEDWDIVQMRGCDPQLGDGECPIGYTCFVHPESDITGFGACMLVDEADRLADACKDYLTSSRRYTVGRSSSGELKLLPRKRELRQTPLGGCTDTAQCTALADYAKQLASSAHPADDMTDPSTRRYECRADPDRPPLDGMGETGKRCIEVCDTSSDCSTGAVCREGVCMEGVIPPQSCVNAPQRYEMRAHDAFVLIGSRSGYVHSTIRDAATDRCVRDPAAHPFDIGRVPLEAPACDPTADLRTGRLPDGTFEPNPCMTTIEQVENVPNYTPGTCTLASPTTVTITREAPAIRFRNRGFMIHLVDPTYPGDQTCIKDGLGMLEGVPTVFPNYQLAWRQTAGLTPLTLNAGSQFMKPAYPIKVVRGPTESIWVIDAGDFISTSITEDSTRGKVFRIEAQFLSKITRIE
ncbi:MAG: hypothetical protein AB7L94_37640 [Kofleriaceae bacterium]